MKSSKKIVSIVILIFIAVLVYAVYRNAMYRYNKPKADSSKNKSVDSATHSNHEGIPPEMGAKPEVDPKDGSVKIVEEFVKSHAQNPATFEFFEWSEISADDSYWKVRCKYRGVASFDKELTTNAWFYIQNNKVVYTKIISKI